jgi:hypothetical protein
MKAFLAEWVNRAEVPHKENVGTAASSDNSLPDEIYIPPDCPNDAESIRTCIDSQLIRKDAS